jgi:exodeoxyribonuclease-5
MLSLVKRMAAAMIPQNIYDETSPSDEQFAAIRAIEDWYSDKRAPQVYFLGGGAGTGKSYTANKVIERLKERNKVKKVASGAYTGKAAHILRKKGVKDATTIHQMIYEPREDEETGEIYFVSRIDGPAAEADLIVLDECSMIDERLANDILMFGNIYEERPRLPPARDPPAGQGKPDRPAGDHDPQWRAAAPVRVRRFGSRSPAHPPDPATRRAPYDADAVRGSQSPLCLHEPPACAARVLRPDANAGGARHVLQE